MQRKHSKLQVVGVEIVQPRICSWLYMMWTPSKTWLANWVTVNVWNMRIHGTPITTASEGVHWRTYAKRTDQ
jgi:hypothetical protein